MNILVLIKQVPSTNKVSVDEKTGVLLRSGVQSKTNPYDLFALETALLIKEKYGAHISVLSMGPMQAQSIIKEAFSMGADEGYLLSDRKFGGADVLATSYTLAQGIKKIGQFDLIIAGKQTTDGDTAQVGCEVAEWLQIPSVSNVIDVVEVKENALVVKNDLSTVIQTLSLPFPCLISVDKDIYEPRLPSYVKKQQTKDKKIHVFTLSDLEDTDEKHYGLTGSPTQVERIFEPQAQTDHDIFKGDKETLVTSLMDKLLQKKLI